MALTRLENGELIDPAVLNDNFDYLDWEIESAVSTITGGSSVNISSLVSQVTSLSSVTPAGTIIMWGGKNTTPLGYLLCDGTAYSKSAHPELGDLFNAIGYTYGGSGDTFNVPDMTHSQIPMGTAISGMVSNGTSQSVTSSISNGSTNTTGEHSHNHVLGSTVAGYSEPAGNHYHSVNGSVTVACPVNKWLSFRFCIKY